ncbi:TonB-dependent receptor [Pedobacter caeni]|uniref:Outer membrane receptor proteins, mostly Fe transport n=1 Tax=Pedobacter caeni TaxID=288992 RepID=A0A1M5NNT4_9SPHI|nr:TonB-dependent receptor [Pedobacter caeni]SHG90593.1 Outer membrane receptor proteins, mostly Fe transport [Pedobacter caeni]
MKKQLLLIVACCLLGSIETAYSKEPLKHHKSIETVTGIVVDKSDQPIVGATVVIKGTKTGTSTDRDGKFALNLTPDAKILIISAIGFKPVEQPVSTSGALKITLLEDLMELNAVVVTGSVNPLKKIESSVAITSFNSKTIQQLAPSSAADLLKHVPGFVVETSGGEVGNNLFSRGIPSAGAYEYVQIQEDGMPVFEDGALQFANADGWLRIDETISRMEALRGGSGSIFATNAPGGIINFITKTGSNDFSGTAKMTTGTSGLFRTDLNVGGALIPDKLFYNIGGFYRTENGVRNPGFKGNDGGQVKMNLKYILDKGFIKLSYKKLNDRNLFLLPIPLTDKNNPKGIDGFNPNTGTLTSRNFSQLDVPQYGGGTFRRNLEDGVHPIVDALGAEFKTDLGGGFTLSNNTRYTKINLEYTAIFPGAEPQSAADFAAKYKANNDIAYPVLNPEYTNVNTGAVVDPALVAKVGYWAIDKQMKNFANNLRFDYKNDKVALSLGYYYSNWTSDQQWNWSNILVSVSDNPQLLNLVDKSVPVGGPNRSRTYNGVTDISWLTRQAQTKGNLNAVFGNAEIKATEQLTFDIGLRYDMDRYTGYKVNSRDGFQNLDNNTAFNNDFAGTTADNSMKVLQGAYQYWKYDVNRLSGSAAANYKFADDMATYFRYSNGFRSPIEEAYFENADKLDQLKPTVINQFELGYKYQAKQFALFANAFYMDLANLAFTDVLLNGKSENKFAKARNYGMELEGQFTAGDFSLTINATLQDPKFTDFSGEGVDNNGNRVRRIPAFYGTIRPAYNLTKNLAIYAEVNHFGKKYSDNENVFALPSFDVLNAGVSLKVKRMRFALDASNLTNTIGLTEGNPRVTTAPGAIYYARPILGRFAKLSAAFDF